MHLGRVTARGIVGAIQGSMGFIGMWSLRLKPYTPYRPQVAFLGIPLLPRHMLDRCLDFLQPSDPRTHEYQQLTEVAFQGRFSVKFGGKGWQGIHETMWGGGRRPRFFARSLNA